MAIKRAITEVDEWDGAASNYDDTDAYCAACLIDVNSAAGNSEKKQSHCMLPVKPPGSNMMADKAVFAAAGGRGIGAVKKPSDVSQADWDKAVQAAAKKIVNAYKELDREAPEAVMEMTRGVTAAQMDNMFKLLTSGTEAGQRFKNMLLKLEKPPEPQERALMFDQVAGQIYDWQYAESGRPYFMTFYLEQGQLYGLFNERGKLFRATIDLEADGETLDIGEMESVVHQFTPVTRSGFYIRRQADGRHRFFMVAGTSILNRVGEIDSTKLYDDMIQRAESTGYYPSLDFYHLGEVDPLFEFGQFDFLGREGVVYVGSGLLEEDHPLTAAALRTLSNDSERWGASIEYYRPENRGMETIDLGSGIQIVAYTEGLNTRISILPETDAACWFTSLAMEKRTMAKKLTERSLEALREFFGDDEEGYESFLGRIKGINKEVRDKNLISRAKDNGEEPADPVAEELEIDDAVINALVSIARTQVENSVMETVTGNLEKITTSLATITESQNNLLAQVNGMQERLTALETEDQEVQQVRQTDMPTRTQLRTKVTYRPSVDKPTSAVTEEEKTYADKAASVLSALPKVGNL